MEALKHILFNITDYFEDSHTFRAVRNGIILIIPVIIINSFATMFAELPISAYQEFLHSTGALPLLTILQSIIAATHDYFAALLAISVGWNFAHEYQMPPHQTILMALLANSCFLILIGIHTDSFSPAFLDISGALSGFIASISASLLYLWLFKKMQITRKLPHSKINPHLYGVIYSIIPMSIVLLLFAIAQNIFLACNDGRCLQTQIIITITDFYNLFAFSPLLSASVFTLLVQLLWFLGLNGQNILHVINNGYYGSLMAQNLNALQTGNVPVHIITETFNNTFLNIGGSGAILALLLACWLFSHDKTVHTVTKLAALPTCFNISEIMSFGLPVVWNPIFCLPFLLAPLVNLHIAYWATRLHFVPIITTPITWTTPPFLSGYIATDSLCGTFLQILLFVIDLFIYAPFVRLYDKQKAYRFTRLVRELEHEHQQLEMLHEALRPQDMNTETQIITTLLANDLRDALKQNELFLLYQPQFDTTGNFIGAEALLRWPHPTAGLIYPPLIISLAKIDGLLPDLEEFIFQEACRGIASLEKQLTGHFKISVNITGDSLKYATLENSLQQAITDFSINPAELWIEITEQDALASTTESIKKLKSLKSHGHKLLIDDFGMGHTSVTYLRTNLFDVVKLDGSITRNVLENENNQQIIASLVSLSKKLDLMVIAEFVDNIPQRDKLAELGCDAFQGYLYSKPISLTDLLDLLKNKPKALHT